MEVWTAPRLPKGWLLPDQASPHSDPADPTSVPPRHHKTHHEVVRRGLHSQLTCPRTLECQRQRRRHKRFGNRLGNRRRSLMPRPRFLSFSNSFWQSQGQNLATPGGMEERRAGCGCSLKRSVRSLCGEQGSGRPKPMAKSSLRTAWVGSKLNSRIYLHFIHSI